MLIIIILQIQILAYDTAYPNNRASVQVIITVIRNANAPEFSKVRYSQKITETFPIGDDILTVSATDKDGVSVFSIFIYLLSVVIGIIVDF